MLQLRVAATFHTYYQPGGPKRECSNTIPIQFTGNGCTQGLSYAFKAQGRNIQQYYNTGVEGGVGGIDCMINEKVVLERPSEVRVHSTYIVPTGLSLIHI